MMGTGIPWCDETINPIVGCSKCSPGCDHCYAERMAWRQAHNTKTLPETREAYQTVTVDGKWSGRTVWRPRELEEVGKWKSPKRIFVCSMSDPFHESVPWEWLLMLNEFFAAHPQHTFMLLTKRPWRAVKFQAAHAIMKWPGNVWMGTTVCNQEEADGKISILVKMNVAVKFLSIEPMLGEINLGNICSTRNGAEYGWSGKKKGGYPYLNCLTGREYSVLVGQDTNNKLDWVICGGETGPGARPMKEEWVRNLLDQCGAAEVPFFFKSWGGPKKKDNDLIYGRRYREFPE